MTNNAGLEGFVDIEGLKVSIKPYCTLREFTPYQAEELLKKEGLRMLTLEEEVSIARELKRRLEENTATRENLSKLPDLDEVGISEELKPLYRIYTNMLNSIGLVKKNNGYVLVMPWPSGEIDEIEIRGDFIGDVAGIYPEIRGVRD